MAVKIPDDLVENNGGRIVLVVMDGLGGLPDPNTGKTELEAANTPNLDRIAERAALGLHKPVAAGVTPGSGPGHLALFGYDPLVWNIGRGILSALGVGFELHPGDVATRLNFASIDSSGNVTDRRAGRPSDDENKRLVAKLRERVKAPDGVELFFESEKEHRAVMILRGANLNADLADTDPQETGVPPLKVTATNDAARETAAIVQRILDDGIKALSDEPKANALLARGFAAYEKYPTMQERFKLRCHAIAKYPMYRGVARLVGMDAKEEPTSDEESVKILVQKWSDYDFHFIHFKATDSRGEDGNFKAKLEAIEAIDRHIAQIDALHPDVMIVTGDHSTPSQMKAHSWHPVPVLMTSQWTRPIPQHLVADMHAGKIKRFGERGCALGELGIFPTVELMSLALANAGRLAKFGA